MLVVVAVVEIVRLVLVVQAVVEQVQMLLQSDTTQP
jgi:hypothetical protein